MILSKIFNLLCRPSSKRWEEAKNEGGAHSDGHYKYNRRKSFSKEFWTLSDYGSTVEAVGWVCEYIIYKFIIHVSKLVILKYLEILWVIKCR